MTGRFRPVSGLLVGLLLVSNVSADFDPRGRRRPGTSGPKVPKPGAATAKPKPARAQEPGARPAPVQSTPATQDEADPGDDSALIQRYKAIVINQPGAAFPLQRLAELVRKRDGNLDALLREFEQRAAASGSQQYASLVALAGLYQQAGEAESAAGAYRRALELAPEKPLALLALSNLQQKRGELAQAKELLERALPRLTDDAEREQALRTLLTLSLDLGDLPAAKRVHEQLVQRAKGSFFVQSELGQQLLARNRLAEAELEFR
jgi:tetratricopeptide (TPR) repeat protein